MTQIVSNEEHKLVLKGRGSTSSRLILEINIDHYSLRSPIIKVYAATTQNKTSNSLGEEYWKEIENSKHLYRLFAQLFLNGLLNLPDEACINYELDPDFKELNQTSLLAISRCFCCSKEEAPQGDAELVENFSPQLKKMLNM